MKQQITEEMKSRMNGTKKRKTDCGNASGICKAFNRRLFA